jgi:hypothetical protein
MDANFTNLNNDKYQSGASPTFTNIYMGQYLYHSGDTNTYLQLLGDRVRVVAGGREMIDWTESASDTVDINQRLHVKTQNVDFDGVFWENNPAVTSSYTITNGRNAMSAGPITINSGITVTVGDGETWTVV